MPSTEASRSAWNFTPSSMALVSPESTVAGVAKSKIVASGVTAFDASDAGLEPTPLVAGTLNVWLVPFFSPLPGAVVASAPTGVGVCALEPMYGVTVWPVIALSPSLFAGVHVTRADCDAASAATPVGAVGTTAPTGVTAFDGADTAPAPLAFSAWTVNVYV